MELRKIQLTGGSSYTVTLPKDWVKHAKLSAGDAVGFLPHPDGSLGMYAHARAAATRQARYEVDLTHEDAEAAFRRIIAAYLTGYDVIVVRSKKPFTSSTRRAVAQAVKRIIGLEIVDEESHSVTLQDFLDPREFHIEKGLRRMHALTRAMQADALRALTEPVEEWDEAFQERDDEVDRLHWMINKQYHAILRDPSYAQRMGLNANQALNFLLVARLMERTADHARRIADNLHALHDAEIKAKLEARIEKHARRAFDLFAAAVAAFHKQDGTAANRVIEEAAEFQRAQEPLIKESLSLGGEEILNVAFALESISRTAAYAADVSETTINHLVAMQT